VKRRGRGLSQALRVRASGGLFSFMTAVLSKSRESKAAPELSEYRKRYPLTVASFGALGNREAWLDSIWRLDERWNRTLGENRGGAREAIASGAAPNGLSIEGEFEIIYAGGALGLIHAATMSHRYRRRVMVFDEGTAGHSVRDWNISDGDLKGFERAGLFTRDEIDSAVVNRYRSGFVKFHDKASRVKTPPLWVDGVLNVAVDANRLLASAHAKLIASATGSAIMSGLRFVRCYVQRERVLVEVEDVRSRRRSLFGARLFVDATNAGSPVARQLNDAASMTHVCPTVGAVARGFMRGAGPHSVDFSVGEILVSNEDARDHRQLIWEGFAGSPARDEYTTRLFFYDAIDSPADKSLLALFERYFEQLPRYKRAGAQWRVLKPIFGYTPAFKGRGLREHQRRTAADRVLLIGDAASQVAPLGFNGFGSHVSALPQGTHLTELALKADLLDAASLSEISAREPRVAGFASFAEFLRPTPKGAPQTVNETLNAVMAALHSLDEPVRRELFQDRMSFSALKRLLSRTVKLYPRIFQHVREHLGARGTFWWLAQLTAAAFTERRKSRATAKDVDLHEEAAREFARHVELYKNLDGADD
jgi:lycopene cyclase CruA